MSSRAPEDICGSVVYEFAVRQAGKKVPEKLKRFGKKRSELGACRELESTRSTETEEDGNGTCGAASHSARRRDLRGAKWEQSWSESDRRAQNALWRVGSSGGGVSLRTEQWSEYGRIAPIHRAPVAVEALTGRNQQ